VLVTCIGTLGRVGISLRECCTNQQINAVVPYEGIDPYFLMYALAGPRSLIQIHGLASATTIAILNKRKFSTVSVPVPPLAEQRRIVCEVDKLFDGLIESEARVRSISDLLGLEVKRNGIGAFRMSILGNALSGRLVPQDSADEPASVLLERLRVTRESGSKGRGKVAK